MPNDDRVYEAYNGNLGEQFQKMTQRRIDWIINMAEKADNILDVGCSQGIISLLLARKGKKVVGLDIQEEAIVYAKRLLQEKWADVINQVDFICSDIIEYETTHKFDCIILTEVIEHLNNPNEVLNKICTLLDDNGILIVSVPFGVSIHPDHKKTYYLNSFAHLLQDYFGIKSIDFYEQWLCAICDKKKMNDRFDVREYLLEQENEFESREYSYISRINDIKENFQNANEKYRNALDNYETAKEWVTSRDEKIELLDRKLTVTNEKYEIAMKNYETAKEWVKGGNDKNKLLEEQLEKVKDELEENKLQRSKLEDIVVDYKQRIEENDKRLMEAEYEIKEKERHLEETDNKISLVVKQLCECLKDYDLAVMNAEQMSREITRLEIQNSALIQKNSEQKKKLDMIENNIFGKMGIKVYKFYKKHVKK